ncbi:hypothetical protein FDA48_05795 [Clostridium botulinum]|nr:hypothetical protein [Clostridium botulinum]
MNLNFTSREKKKTNEIKININDNVLIKGKIITQVFKFKSILEICNFLNNIESNIRLKVLINYKNNEFYIFKTKNNNKKNHSQENQISNQEIASLFKFFYSEDKFKLDNCTIKNTKKIKYEIAPKNFEIHDNYLLTENRYINVISLDYLGEVLNIKNIIKNMDCWLSIDCYKVNREFILSKLSEMKEDNVIEKKFTDFILNKIDHIMEKINKENILQCEIKMLLYNSNLNYINNENRIIKENISKNYCTSYTPQEKINTRKLFEKCIYPNLSMDIIHSITDTDLFKLIGVDTNV